jgi:anti-sigma factor RsiW
MSCPERLTTQAFIDGELEDERASAAERHLETCADCQAFVADAAEISDRLRAASRRPAPAALRARIAQGLDREEARAAPAPLRPRRARNSFWRGAATGALGGAGLTGLAAALAVFALLPPAPQTLLTQLADAHTDALMAGRTIAVVSSDRHTVKPWFAGRIDLSPPAVDFAGQGFKLTGGRLDHVGKVPAAVVVYQHGRHEIDLFVWASRPGERLPPSGLRHGYHALVWTKGDLDFAALSDTQPEALAYFAALVRSQPE